jgi:predicted ester cyclase
VNSPEELKEYLRSEFEILSDGHKTIEDMVAESDKVAIRHGFRGARRGEMGS